jgi:hypothetical protein
MVGWNAGTTTYDIISTAQYSSGRVTASRDALDNLTRTDYLPAEGGLVTQSTVTNALNHRVITTVNPAWGLATSTLDANDKRAR